MPVKMPSVQKQQIMVRGQLKLFFRFLKLILPHKGRWLIILLLSGLSSLIGLVNPYLTKLVIDKAVGNRDLKLFFILSLIGGTAFLLGIVMGALKQYLERYIRIKVGFELNRRVFQSIQRLPFSWFQNKSTGENIYHISYDSDRVRDFITTTPPQVVSIFPQLIITIFIVFKLNWQMALLTLCLAPFMYLPYYFITKRMRNTWQLMIENSQEIFKGLQEIFSHIQLVKAFGKELASTRRYLRKIIKGIRLELKNIKLEIVSGISSQVLSKVVTGLITFYGMYNVIRGNMTLGTFSAIIVYLMQLLGLQGQFAFFFQTSVMGLVSCQRVAYILDEADQTKVRFGKADVNLREAEINFKDVSFGYNKGEYILKNLSFSIPFARHIALVGPSGCGKTTILNLIVRLYEPWSGRITVDNLNIKEISPESLISQVGIALQEPFLWDDTIENNIRYGREGATLEEIIELSKITGVNDFVQEMPLKYLTVIGENACKISEGQKQKIAITRALIKNPRVLILDEAMSSMDSASEEKIISGLKDHFPGLAVITVSHRLSTVMKSDLVYYLLGPEVMRIDTVENILVKDADFAKLFVGQKNPLSP
jgi:ABC-type bacteriocin/lantibiotic exporter with double-glycine peptidase domain